MNGILTFVVNISNIAESRAIWKAAIQIGKKLFSKMIAHPKTHADYTTLATGFASAMSTGQITFVTPAGHPRSSTWIASAPLWQIGSMRYGIVLKYKSPQIAGLSEEGICLVIRLNFAL